MGTRLLTTLGLLALLAAATLSAIPGWWTGRGVIKADATANDYAAANQGQLKNMAKAARDEMQVKYAGHGGAGPVVNAQVDAWLANSENARDYAPVTLGQLKAVAKPFYDRLIELHERPPGSYPWQGGEQARDYAMANIGQLKRVFSFDIGVGDSDLDGLPDFWEMTHFGSIETHDGNGNPDNDGLSNAQELALQTNPAVNDTDGDGAVDGAEVAQGTDPTDASNFVAAVREILVTAGETINATLAVNNPKPDSLSYTAVVSGGILALGNESGGYAASVSGTPLGPAYSWQDIRYTGQRMPLPAANANGKMGVASLSFPFSFFGQQFQNLYVWEDGFITFSDVQSYVYIPTSLPSTYGPPNLVSGLSKNYDMKAGGGVFFKDFGTHAIIQYDRVRSSSYDVSEYTFQIVLAATGEITCRYKQLPTSTTQRPGIQNAARDAGAMLAQAQPLTSGMAVRFAGNHTLLQMSPLAGTLPASGSGSHDLQVNARPLAPGSYDCSVEISAEGAATWLQKHPVRIKVLPAPSVALQGVTNGQMIIPGGRMTLRCNISNPTAQRTYEVRYFLDGNHVDLSTEAPYYQVTKTNPFWYGKHVVWATATDQTGRVTTSDLIEFAADDVVDQDGDRMSDFYEEMMGLDTAVAADAFLDGDADGFPNFVEFYHNTRCDSAASKPAVTLVASSADSFSRLQEECMASGIEFPVVRLQNGKYDTALTIYNNSNTTIRGLMLLANPGDDVTFTGGAWVDTNAALVLQGLRFAGNDGNGIYIARSSHAALPVLLSRCISDGNDGAGLRLSGFYGNDADPRALVGINNCIIVNNTGKYASAGGIETTGRLALWINQCTVSMNKVDYYSNATSLHAGLGTSIRAFGNIFHNVLPAGQGPLPEFHRETPAGTAEFVIERSTIRGGHAGTGNIMTAPSLRFDGRFLAKTGNTGLINIFSQAKIKEDIDGEPRPGETNTDFGADEWKDSENNNAGDSLPDWWELKYYGDLSRTATDNADGDNLTAYAEYLKGTDPTKGDTDNDGLLDHLESDLDALNPDRDGDGMKDGYEVAHGLNPNSAADRLEDKDGDRYPNVFEAVHGSFASDATSYPANSEATVVTPEMNLDSAIDGLNHEYPILKLSSGVYDRGELDIAPSNSAVPWRAILVLSTEIGGAVLRYNAEYDESGSVTVSGDAVLDGLTCQGSVKDSGLAIFGETEVRVKNCRLENHRGSGMTVSYVDNVWVEGCVFSGNLGIADYADLGAGGITVWGDSHVRVTHCTFANNGANPKYDYNKYARGIYAGYYSFVEVSRSIIWDPLKNRTYTSGLVEAIPEVVYDSTQPPSLPTLGITVTQTDIRGGHAGTGNLNVEPALRYDGYLAGSTGNNAQIINKFAPPASGPYLPYYDLNGETRPQGVSADMGADEWKDADTDGLPDWWEYKYFGDLSRQGSDHADADTLTTVAEFLKGTDPTLADTDDDGIPDHEETGLDALKPDRDGDGMKDGYEVAHGLNPNSAADRLEDKDGDRYPNIFEAAHGSDASLASSYPAASEVHDLTPAASFYSVTRDLNEDYPILKLAPGTYDKDTLSLNPGNAVKKWRSILVLCADPGTAICKKGSPYQSAGAIYISGDAVVDGLACEGSQYNAGIVISGADEVRIKNCRIDKHQGVGISVSSTPNVWIEGAFITNNQGKSGARAGGLDVQYGCHVRVIHCTFSGNTVEAPYPSSDYARGIYASQGAWVEVSRSIVWDPTKTRILADDLLEALPEVLYDSTVTPVPAGSGLTVNESVIRGGYSQAGSANNLNVAPLLRFDGHLAQGQPGNGHLLNKFTVPVGSSYSPAFDVDGESRTQVTGADIGADEWIDGDGDGLADWWEQLIFGSLNSLAADNTDGDALTAAEEYSKGTNPNMGDTDEDGLLDHLESDTDALNPDRDSDGMKDGYEVAQGLNPNSSVDRLEDKDGDRYPNVFEAAHGSDASDALSYPGDDDVTIVTPTDDITWNFNETFPILRLSPGIYDGGIYLTNYSSQPGRAILVISPQVGGAVFKNSPSAYYGSYFQVSCDAVVDGVTVTGSKGDGINIYSDEVRLRNCRIDKHDGTGVSISGSADVWIENSVVASNRGQSRVVGGVNVGQGSHLRLIHSTITGNSAAGYYWEAPAATGIKANWGALVEASNSILWDPAQNWTGTNGVVQTIPEVFADVSAPPEPGEGFVITHSAVRGGYAGVGNIATAPAVLSDGHLSAGSGANAALINAVPVTGGMLEPKFDIDAEARPQGSALDIGADEWLDTDSDGLPDWFELRYFTSVIAGVPESDTDDDGLTLLEELIHGTHPVIADTDADGLKDGAEIAGGLNPLLADTDADDMRDGYEVENDLDPLDAKDATADADGDRYPNIFEANKGTDPQDASKVPLFDAEVTSVDGIESALTATTAPYVILSVRTGVYLADDLVVDVSQSRRGVLLISSAPLKAEFVVKRLEINGSKALLVVDGLHITADDVDIDSDGLTILSRNYVKLTGEGGGVRLTGTSEVVGSMIVSAKAGDLLRTNGAKVVSSTIYSSAPNLAGDWYPLKAESGSLEVRESIVWAPGSINGISSHAAVSISNSIVAKTPAGVNGNLNVNPFLTPDGFITKLSVAVDRLAPTVVLAGTDLHGETRPQNTSGDIGADEWKDSDSDGMPDWWEFKYFGSPIAGNPDSNPDNDDIYTAQEYLLGTSPLVPDLLGGDGTDASNELVAELPDRSSSRLIPQGGGYTLELRRGYMEYDLTVNRAGFYRLSIESSTVTSFYSTVPLDIYVDGRMEVSTQSGAYLDHQLPYLRSGNHLVRIAINGTRHDAAAVIKAVRLLWDEEMNAGGITEQVALQQRNTLSGPVSSKVSPAFIEGKTPYYAGLSAAISGNAISVQSGIGDAWYANVPLPADGSPTTATVSYESGLLQRSKTISWAVTNVLDGDILTIRKGDQVRLSGFTTASSPTDPVAIKVNGTSVGNTTAGSALVFPFDTAGIFQVSATLGAAAPVEMTVVVLGAGTDFTTPYYVASGTLREWVLPSVQPGTYLEVDPLVGLDSLPVASGSKYNIMATVPGSYNVLARLHPGGPVIAKTQINCFRFISAQASGGGLIIGEVSPGVKLLRAVYLVEGPIPPNLKVTIQIWYAGAQFDNGSTTKDFYSSQGHFDANGMAYAYIHAPGYICQRHTLTLVP